MKLPPQLDGHSSEYCQWRDRRLARQANSRSVTSTAFMLQTTTAPTSAEPAIQDFRAVDLTPIVQAVSVHGYARYRFSDSADDRLMRSQVTAFVDALGLHRSDQGVIADDDALTLLEHRADSQLARFPPFSNRPLNWHTDGYYNVQPAAEGGELTLLDPELLLIAIYQHDETIIDYLCEPDSMMLPGSDDQYGHRRPDTAVPVFFAHEDGTLGMRFTTRSRNIRWKNAETRAAASRVVEIIESIPQHLTHLTLNRCEGIVTRNILHRRSHYVDVSAGNRRQMLRGRYLDNLKPGLTGKVV